MIFSGVMLSVLLKLLLAGSAQTRRADCKSECCLFVEDFPVKLKELRSSYRKIQKLYESNDDLEPLLDATVQQNINSPHGCHVMEQILHFYLETVLPSAVQNNHTILKMPIDTIGHIFEDLKRKVLKCKNYFSCKKPFDLTHMKHTYENMKEEGVFKAMGELDLLFRYIEQYLASKRIKH